MAVHSYINISVLWLKVSNRSSIYIFLIIIVFTLGFGESVIDSTIESIIESPDSIAELAGSTADPPVSSQ